MQTFFLPLLNLILLGYYVGVREIIGKVLNFPKKLLESLGVPDYLIPELIGPLIIFVVLFSIKPIRIFLKRFLRWVVRKAARWLGIEVETEEASKLDESKEKNYLKWLTAELKSISLQWHETPIVPTPAHKKRPLGRLHKYRAKLFRYNPNDYMQNPALSDAELSIRAGFGRRVKIRNLAKELRGYKKIVVLGDPGSGKSVCLRQLAYDLCERELSRDGRPPLRS